MALTEHDIWMCDHDLDAANFVHMNPGNPLKPMDKRRRELCVERFVKTFGGPDAEAW